MYIEKILTEAKEKGVADIFIVPGRAISFKQNNRIISCDDNKKIFKEETFAMVTDIYNLAGRDISHFEQTGDDDFSFATSICRYRVNAYKQRGTYAAVIRLIPYDLPKPEDKGIPSEIMALADESSGLILVTGPAGSGKSTTLACLINKINCEQQKHIITLEDPIEFIHSHKDTNSIVSQREVSIDTDSYISALRASLRQSPDVILLGEMRDFETINTAVTAAETGHLIFSSLHTISAKTTVERIIDAFPAEQQQQISIQLASVLKYVVCQKLVESVDLDSNGNPIMVPVFEIMRVNNAIKTMIRDKRFQSITNEIYTNRGELKKDEMGNAKGGMCTMDDSLFKLYENGKITAETALKEAEDPIEMKNRLA